MNATDHLINVAAPIAAQGKQISKDRTVKLLLAAVVELEGDSDLGLMLKNRADAERLTIPVNMDEDKLFDAQDSADEYRAKCDADADRLDGEIASLKAQMEEAA